MAWPEIFPDDTPGREKFCYECSVPGCTWKTWHRTMPGAYKERKRHEEVSCPYTEGIGMAQGPTLHEKLWEELDSACAVVMDGKPEGYAKDAGVSAATCDPYEARKYDEARGNARGLAIAICHMGTPFWTDATEVSKHAVKRFNAKKAGEEMPPTLGVGGYNPHLQDDRKKVKAKETEALIKEATTKRSPAKKAAGKPITDEVKATIAAAISGGIPAASVAKLYNISTEEVEQIVAAAAAA